MSKETENKQEDQHSDVELAAMDKGWRPKEEWEGDPELWVDAGEFTRRGELMDRISDQTKQLRTAQQEIELLKKDFNAVADHNKKLAEKEYEKALKKLKEEKKEAIELGQGDAVVDLDERIDELKEARKDLDSEDSRQEPNTQNNQQTPPEIIDWQDKNSWYGKDIAMTGAMDAYVDAYVQQNPQHQGNFDKILSEVTSQIKQDFPDRFEDAPRQRRSATTDTSSTGRTSGTKARYSMKDLNEDQRRVAKRFASSGLMTEKEYIQQLADLGEI